MSEFYSECLSEMKLPERFDCKELETQLMIELKKIMRKDKDFTTLIARLTLDYPSFPMDNKSASEYVIALKDLNARVVTAGLNMNAELARDSLRSKVPFFAFSSLYLSTHTISYFHAFRAKMTEQYFRHSHFLIRERPNLKKRRTALEHYLNVIKSAEDLFKPLLKAQFKLWLIINLSNYTSSKDFPQNPTDAAYDVDLKELETLENKHNEILEEMRRHLYDSDPTLFNPTMCDHHPTETLWKNLVLIGTSQ